MPRRRARSGSGTAYGVDRLRHAPSATPSDHSGAGNFGENVELDDFLERDEAYRQIMTLSGVGAESPLDDGAGDRMWSDDVFGSLSAPHFRRSAADSVVGNGVGTSVGSDVGNGVFVGNGVLLGTGVGSSVGSRVGSPVGSMEGSAVGAEEGFRVGSAVGSMDGSPDGASDGTSVG